MRSFKPLRPLWAWLIIPLLAGVTVIAGERRSADDSLFSESVYTDRVSYLASDELEGRGTGQEGINKAADYIAAEFAAMGVQPGGDDNTYFQNFTLSLSKRIADGTLLQVGLDGAQPDRTATLSEEYTVFPFSSSEAFEGEVVFASYGIICEGEDYNDYAGIDVADKVVLVLRRAPRFGDFSRTDMAFRTKASRANGRDAAALLIVNPTFDEDDDELYSFGESSLGGPGTSGPSYGLPMLHIRRELAEQLLKAGGLPDLATIEKQIDETEKPMSAPLQGVRLRGQVKIEPVESPVRNVVGVVPGQGPNADEYIVLGAHYDHLGIIRKGEDDFDPDKHIWNGADDNASGTALVMMLAEAFTRGPAPNRSLLLILFTGEERGLLGSKYYVDHPTVDLKKMVAMLNFDMVGRLRNDSLEVGGMRTGGFEEIVHRLAEDHELKIKDGGGGRGPSDHTSFYNKNIPVMFFFTGLHRQYHQPDDLVELLNIPGAIRIAKFVADVVDEIDAVSQAPQFVKDNRRKRIDRQAIEEDDDDTRVAARSRRDRGETDGPGAPTGRVRLGIHPDASDTKGGVRVIEVIDDTPAARAGLKEDDRIVRFRDTGVDGIEDLLAVLESLEWGDETTVVVQRGGKDVELPIVFGEARATKDHQVSTGTAPQSAKLEDATASQDHLVTLVDAYLEWIQRREAILGRVVEITREDTSDERVVKIDGLHSAQSVQVVEELSALAKRVPADARRLVTTATVATGDDGEIGTWVTIRVAMGASAVAGAAARGRALQHPAVSADGEKIREQTVVHGHGHAHAHGGHGASNTTKTAKGASQDVAHADPHAESKDDTDDDVTSTPMPPVRLGIMPSYGETEGEGYEITGVVEDGPADKAGMQDDDRIYKIGETLVTDVYSYMDALQKYKAGEVIMVTVIRNGEKIMLRMKAEGPRGMGEAN